MWRFATLVLTALLMGMTFCHVLEMPAKMQYTAPLYLTIHRTLYVDFGPPNVGVFVEMGAILASGALAVLMWRRPGFWPTLTGAASLAAGILVYFAQVEPANAALKVMAIEAPPADWATWRAQWEYGHAMHFVLDLLGFCALVVSVLVPSPAPTSASRQGTAYREERLHLR
jgi:hypothetical protein